MELYLIAENYSQLSLINSYQITKSLIITVANWRNDLAARGPWVQHNWRDGEVKLAVNGACQMQTHITSKSLANNSYGELFDKEQFILELSSNLGSFFNINRPFSIFIDVNDSLNTSFAEVRTNNNILNFASLKSLHEYLINLEKNNCIIPIIKFIPDNISIIQKLRQEKISFALSCTGAAQAFIASKLKAHSIFMPFNWSELKKTIDVFENYPDIFTKIVAICQNDAELLAAGGLGIDAAAVRQDLLGHLLMLENGDNK